jgi:hypothetical protein
MQDLGAVEECSCRERSGSGSTLLDLPERVQELHSSPSESIDAMSQCLTVIVNNMMANVVVLMVGELFSKLKSSEVDRGVRAKIENPTDAHSLALILVQGLMLAVFETIFLSCLVSMRDEEFDVLGEEDLALLSRQFERMYTNRKNAQKSSGMC